MLGMTLISILELRSVILQHHDDKEMLGVQSTATSLSLIVLLLEILTPRPSNFVRKSTILEERAREASETSNGNRSPSPGSNGEYEDDEEDERSSLLPRSQRHTLEESDDEDLDDEDEMLAALDLMPDDHSISELKEKERKDRVTPPPEIRASIFSLATFTYIGCERFYITDEPFMG